MLGLINLRRAHLLVFLSILLEFFMASSVGATVVDKECPLSSPGIEESDFPGYDAKNVKSFSRDQDSVGNCYAHMWADFLAYHAKKNKVWPSTSMYSSGASAMDIMLQLAEVSSQNFLSVEKFIDAHGLDIIENSQQMADRMAKLGLCAEKQFPSEFLPKETGAFDKYLSFGESFNKLRGTEAGVSDLYWCPECLTIAPGLNSNSSSASNLKKNAEEVLKLISQMKKQSNSFEAFKLLNEKSCPANQRIKFPPLKMKSSGNLAELDEQIRNGNPVMVSLGSSAVMNRARMSEAKKNSKDGRVAGHAAVVVGAARFPEMPNSCYYLIKNSWGDHCQADFPQQICLKSGAMAIRSDLFKDTMVDGRWAEQ